ncbi:mitochondrial carrier protein MTM1-like protein [Carex littledalei]|uniref:Mitochondrial carrier protein MTM1-like protein n=1 Tax=Carex littledalei TaxID=544730 RepID=A0A833VMJ8_9POAL|nr:mitochondrial carrier protein MTM1-like protein [Carex littledalei]
MEPSSSSSSDNSLPHSEYQMGFAERAVAAAGAAVVSAVLVNPLDVAKTRLQAQAAGVIYNPMWPDFRCYPSCSPNGLHGSGPACNPECFQYKGTMDVFYKIGRQEGFGTLWRGTGASLLLAVPTVGIYLPSYDLLRNWIEGYTNQSYPHLTPYAPLFAGPIARTLACIACSPIELARTRMQAFKESGPGANAPGMWKTLLSVLSLRQNTSSTGNGYRLLWTGLGAQLARDVPFSAICWTTLEPIRRRLMELVGDEGNVTSVIGANFSAGFVAGILAASATCPLDVAKTRRQIEASIKGLFRGVGPRVGRAGPSVGIVVSSYEVVKYIIHRRRSTTD